MPGAITVRSLSNPPVAATVLACAVQNCAAAGWHRHGGAAGDSQQQLAPVPRIVAAQLTPAALETAAAAQKSKRDAVLEWQAHCNGAAKGLAGAECESNDGFGSGIPARRQTDT